MAKFENGMQERRRMVLPNGKWITRQRDIREVALLNANKTDSAEYRALVEWNDNSALRTIGR